MFLYLISLSDEIKNNKINVIYYWRVYDCYIFVGVNVFSTYSSFLPTFEWNT